jgi:hypothetical protein
VIRRRANDRRPVAPDHVIDNYAHFYDREALTEFIHGLY